MFHILFTFITVCFLIGNIYNIIIGIHIDYGELKHKKEKNLHLSLGSFSMVLLLGVRKNEPQARTRSILASSYFHIPAEVDIQKWIYVDVDIDVDETRPHGPGSMPWTPAGPLRPGTF